MIYTDFIAQFPLFLLHSRCGPGDEKTGNRFTDTFGVSSTYRFWNAAIGRLLWSCVKRLLLAPRGVPRLGAKIYFLMNKTAASFTSCWRFSGVFCRGIVATHFCPEVHLFVDFKRYRVEMKNNKEERNNVGTRIICSYTFVFGSVCVWSCAFVLVIKITKLNLR